MANARLQQRSFSDKFWKDKNGNVVIYQTPNVWLIGWFILWFASILTYGNTSRVLGLIGSVVLAIWALLEIFQGVNYFRRILGAVIFLAIIASIFGG